MRARQYQTGNLRTLFADYLAEGPVGFAVTALPYKLLRQGTRRGDERRPAPWKPEAPAERNPALGKHRAA